MTNDADWTALATTTVVVATDGSTDGTTAVGTQTDQSGDPTTRGPTTTVTGPGFGVVIALLALLTTALVARRQRR